MDLQNIGAGNKDDAFYRYKMPRMITKIEGRGNGIKTNIVNMVDIAKALGRPASYTTKHFGCELGAQSKFDEKTGASHVNGAHDTSKLAGLLENFIKKFVQCYGCGNPETEIIITKSQMINLKCAACGFISGVDMRDKLTTFILKNPPESKKGSKDKKAMRRAEKERLKEGEAADEEVKKLKKDAAKKKGSSGNLKEVAAKAITKKKSIHSDEDHSPNGSSHADDHEVECDDDDDKKAMRRAEKERLKEGEAADEEVKKLKKDAAKKKGSSGNLKEVAAKAITKKKSIHSDEDHSPNGSSHADDHEVECDDDDDDNIQWQTDTSSLAAQQRIKEQLNAVTASMVMLSTDEEKPKSGKTSPKRATNEIKKFIKKGSPVSQFKPLLQSLFGMQQQITDALFEALFEGVGKGFAKEVVKKRNYLAAAVEEEGSQAVLLRAVESFCGKASNEAVKEVALVLKALYDSDVVEEEFIVEWYEKGVNGSNKGSPIWKNVKPFVEWLQSAESESED